MTMDLTLHGWIHALIFAIGLGLAIRISRLLLLRVWGIPTEAREAGIIFGAVSGLMIATGLTRDVFTACVLGTVTVLGYVMRKVMSRKH